MPDPLKPQSNVSANTHAPIYTSPEVGQTLQQSNKVVGAYGQYSPAAGPTRNIAKSNHMVELAGIMSHHTAQNAQRSTAAPAQFAPPKGSNLAHPSGPGSLQPHSQPQPNIEPPQNLAQSPQTYVNNSVNQYRRPIAPPQNRATGINSQQVFPSNQSLYARGSVIPGQKPNPNQPQQRNGLFGKPPGPRQRAGQQPKVVDKNSVEYLRGLNPTELRREVINTEIEIQKTLVQSEKAYREGVSTIRDLISPSSLKVSTGSLEIGTKMIRTFFVLTYPRVINSGWLEGVVNADVPMDLSIFIYPRDSSEVLKELKSKVGKIQASLQLNSEKGAARDPQLETAYRDVEGLRDAIQQGVERFFKVGVYITIYADNADQLEKYSQTVESVLAQQSIIMKRAALQMDDGFNSSLPILKDDLDVLNNMNTSPLSASFPFVSSELSSNDGILYGVNRHNNSLIIFDRFELENANSLIFATSGAGKSYTVKLEILRSLMLGVSVIVIDPEQEYKLLCDKLGGVYINFSLNSVNRINPFDLPKALPGESTGDILRSAIVDLMGLMNLMLGKLTPTEESIMERAIKESYAKRDITDSADLNSVVSPTMSDLVEILEGIVGGESLAQRLYKYTDGTFAGIFNQRSNIDINNNFVVFNIRDLQETLRPIAMYVLLKFIWNEIRSKLKKRIVAVDEAWIMMQYEDSARFLYGLVKRARKYYLGVTTITQDVGDFLNSPFGKPIVTNAAMKILLKQSSAAIDTIADTFALTSGEKQVLLQSEVGQGIFFAGPRHVAIDIIAFPREHMIITTNPKELLKQQGLDEAGDAL
jgi:conjugal transfer ATP-binding protein TraC